jgi:putative oxidoreductase
MKIAIVVARVLLGVAFIIFGANILHPFMPMPPPPEGSLTAQFMTVMWPTGYMAVVGAFQLVGGICVLLGRTAPLGLSLLAPVLVNILAFHIFLQNGEGLAPGIFCSVLELFLIYAYRANFRGIFTTQAKPTNS